MFGAHQGGMEAASQMQRPRLERWEWVAEALLLEVTVPPEHDLADVGAVEPMIQSLRLSRARNDGPQALGAVLQEGLSTVELETVPEGYELRLIGREGSKVVLQGQSLEFLPQPRGALGLSEAWRTADEQYARTRARDHRFFRFLRKAERKLPNADTDPAQRDALLRGLRDIGGRGYSE